MARSFDSDRLMSFVDGADADDDNAGGVDAAGTGVPDRRLLIFELSACGVCRGVCRGFALMLSRSPLRFTTMSSPGSP